jgi:hypothetical protein
VASVWPYHNERSWTAEARGVHCIDGDCRHQWAIADGRGGYRIRSEDAEASLKQMDGAPFATWRITPLQASTK